MAPQEYIKNLLKNAADKLGYFDEDINQLILEKPKQSDFGDYSTPVAMSLARIAKKSPRLIAQELLNNLEIDTFYLDKVDIAGPGFLNFYLAKSCLQESVLNILDKGEKYGQSNFGQDKIINLEFVSANPTGPLNVVSARAASVGDVLAHLFNNIGYKTSKEYYINDAGRQIFLLGESLAARYLSELGEQLDVPKDGYHGNYLIDLARQIIEQDGEKYKAYETKKRNFIFSQKALEYMLDRHQASMKEYRVEYDVWFRESTIRKENTHLDILEKLKSNNYTFEKDGAIWFKSSDFGDEKDRVLVTADGRPTYFLVDIAYHENKYSRGFDKLVDFWGPDHHGYIPRMRAALQALGHPPESFDVCIIQQVNLLRHGQPVKMSKRAGEIIEMDELIEEVGVDIARFFFVDRRISQPMDFDIDLAKNESEDNPSLYVQYAHARICNVIQYAEEQGIVFKNLSSVSGLEEEIEFAVIKKLLDFPDIIIKSAITLEPHRLTAFLTELATLYHKFYHDIRIVTDDLAATESRLLLCRATRQVLANGLKLLGISAPTYM